MTNSAAAIPFSKGLCRCGCGQQTKIAKYRRPGRYEQGEAMRYLPNHCHVGMAGKKKEIRYIVEPVSGCWIWQLSVNNNGYGKEGAYEYAHINSYIRHKGPIPEGMELDHLCRNHACINPDHLEAVTRTINVRRGAQTRLSVGQVREIRAFHASGFAGFRRLAKMFNVHRSTVQAVVTRKTWKDIDVTADRTTLQSGGLHQEQEAGLPINIRPDSVGDLPVQSV